MKEDGEIGSSWGIRRNPGPLAACKKNAAIGIFATKFLELDVHGEITEDYSLMRNWNRRNAWIGVWNFASEKPSETVACGVIEEDDN